MVPALHNAKKITTVLIARTIMKHPTPVCLFNEDDEANICDDVYYPERVQVLLPAEEEDAQKREWERKYSHAHKLAIVRLHVNLGHPNGTTLSEMLSDAGASDELQKCAAEYACPTCATHSHPKLRRPASVPRTELQ